MPSTPSGKASVHTISVPQAIPTSTAKAATAVAHPASAASGQDLVQVVNQGGKVVWNLNSQGVAAINPVNPTQGASLGVYQGNSFRQAFSIFDQSDFYQIHNGSKVIYHVDYLGNAYTP